MAVLEFKRGNLYCPQGKFAIDPSQPVERAVITHAHADHARPIAQSYLAHVDCVPFLRARLGAHFSYQALQYGEKISIEGVEVSLHPAGHIPGSAQVRVANKKEVAVVSGDYNLGADGICEPFVTVPCDTFVTESTFALPLFSWRPDHEVFAEINSWWHNNQKAGVTSVILAYSLGKAQRIINGVDRSIGPFFAHGAVQQLNDIFRSFSPNFPPTTCVRDDSTKLVNQGALVVAPPAVLNTGWLKKFGKISVGFASGWMASRSAQHNRGYERGFVLSDHADWRGLNEAVRATGASKIYVTHGYTAIFVRWLREQGFDAAELEPGFLGASSPETCSTPTPTSSSST